MLFIFTFNNNLFMFVPNYN